MGHVVLLLVASESRFLFFSGAFLCAQRPYAKVHQTDSFVDIALLHGVTKVQFGHCLCEADNS